MKLVLDTNVYLAAFATRGLCFDLFDYCIDRNTVYICSKLLAELSDKLRTKFKLPKEEIQSVVSLVERNALNIQPCFVDGNVCRDPKDLFILGLSHAADVDYIITGDKDLLVLGCYKKAQIVSPRQFFELHVKAP